MRTMKLASKPWIAQRLLMLKTYRRDDMRSDLLAALLVSVLLIPQSLAYAMLAGLPPQIGLYASLLPLLAYALWGSSPVLGVGPVAVLALMIAQALGGLPAGVSLSEAALVLAAEVGLILLLASALRLDALASLLSVPVLHGFETGATLDHRHEPAAGAAGQSSAGLRVARAVGIHAGKRLCLAWLERGLWPAGLCHLADRPALVAARQRPPGAHGPAAGCHGPGLGLGRCLARCRPGRHFATAGSAPQPATAERRALVAIGAQCLADRLDRVCLQPGRGRGAGAPARREGAGRR